MNKLSKADEFYRKGVILYNGVRTRSTMEEMVKLFREAAELGHLKAMYALCKCYFVGLGVKKDMPTARFWCLQAAEKGLEIAKRNLIYIDYRIAHKWSDNNIKAVLRSKKCGCFHCGRIFDASEIYNSKYGLDYKFALCPYCGIDSVIPDASGYPITEEFLEGMRNTWFGCGILMKGNKKVYIDVKL